MLFLSLCPAQGKGTNIEGCTLIRERRWLARFSPRKPHLRCTACTARNQSNHNNNRTPPCNNLLVWFTVVNALSLSTSAPPPRSPPCSSRSGRARAPPPIEYTSKSILWHRYGLTTGRLHPCQRIERPSVPMDNKSTPGNRTRQRPETGGWHQPCCGTVRTKGSYDTPCNFIRAYADNNTHTQGTSL